MQCKSLWIKASAKCINVNKCKCKETLMCLLQHCICVSRPCEILGDVNAEELKAVYPLHRCLVDADGCVFSVLSPEIHHQLLGLVDVE